MTRFRPLFFTLLMGFSVAAGAQSCPKVAYTTPAATTRQMVTSVNCLVAHTAVNRAGVNKAGFMVESFPVIGPQHTHRYKNIVLAVISVPTGNETKTGLVTPDNPSATVAGTAGAECKLKINSDNTVDGQCNQTGGNIFVVYNN
jgi:hypothetical protein